MEFFESVETMDGFACTCDEDCSSFGESCHSCDS